jgi:sugar phosphate isomerase/epimerase
VLALSLPSRYLTGARDDDTTDLWRAMLGPPSEGLRALAGLGVGAIEVGDVRGENDADVVADALAAVRAAGMRPHAHLWLPPRFSPDGAPATLVAAVRALADPGAAPAACAIHGHRRNEPDAFATTVRDLCALEPWLRANGASTALEVCRHRPGGPLGGTYAEVMAIVRAAEAALGTTLGVTWDLGHTTWNHLQGCDALWPDEAFLTRVTHVHVHDVGPTGRTHFPLDEGRAPLPGFVERLRGVRYAGTWDLELYPARWPGTAAERRSRLDVSVAVLSEAVS